MAIVSTVMLLVLSCLFVYKAFWPGVVVAIIAIYLLLTSLDLHLEFHYRSEKLFMLFSMIAILNLAFILSA